MKPVLYLSYYFKRKRQEYYDQLQSIREQGTWEDWLLFFLSGVVEVSKQAADTARRVLLLREEHRTAITDKLGRAAGNGHRLLEHLYEHPIVSVNEAQQLTGTTFQAANDLVNKFATHGIVSEITGHTRNRRFLYRDYIHLFNDETD